MLAHYYMNYEVVLPFYLVQTAWNADCSGVDRCWRLSWRGNESASFVCTASVSAQLPLWSNARQCAQCPAWSKVDLNFSKSKACDQARFGDMDGSAGTYLDFWSADVTLRYVDTNGPYSSTCSELRNSNNRSHFQAGRVGSDHCVDCLGNDCVDTLLMDTSITAPLGNKIMPAVKHCNKRFACSAFNFDDGKCDENFFSAVCNTSYGRATGEYPRTFSDLPGFAFFRNWSHSYVDSCSRSSTPTKATAPLTPNQRLRLRALCHLHKRCVREHPDFQCAPTPDEARARRVREKAGEMDARTWKNLPISVASHLFKWTNMSQFISAIFIFYLVACDIARTCHMCSQNMLFLDIASKQRRAHSASVRPLHDVAGGGPESIRWQKCRRLMCGGAARLLQHILRNVIVLFAIPGTSVAVHAVSTPLNVIFNGTVMLIILQVHHVQLATLLTDRKQVEIATQYSVVITTKEERMLQRELAISFWSVWGFLISFYFVYSKGLGGLLEHPDNVSSSEFGIEFWVLNLPPLLVLLFVWVNTIMEAVFRVYHRDISPSLLCKHLTVELVTRSVFFITAYIIFCFSVFILQDYQ